MSAKIPAGIPKNTTLTPPNLTLPRALPSQRSIQRLTKKGMSSMLIPIKRCISVLIVQQESCTSVNATRSLSRYFMGNQGRSRKHTDRRYDQSHHLYHREFRETQGEKPNQGIRGPLRDQHPR